MPACESPPETHCTPIDDWVKRAHASAASLCTRVRTTRFDRLTRLEVVVLTLERGQFAFLVRPEARRTRMARE